MPRWSEEQRWQDSSYQHGKEQRFREKDGYLAPGGAQYQKKDQPRRQHQMLLETKTMLKKLEFYPYQLYFPNTAFTTQCYDILTINKNLMTQSFTYKRSNFLIRSAPLDNVDYVNSL